MRSLAVAELWEAAGRPRPNWVGRSKKQVEPPVPRRGVCALTGATGLVFDARFVISGNFTTWDRLGFADVDPEGVAFCEAAAWAFRERALMLRPHVLVDGFFQMATPSELFSALEQLPCAVGTILVPVSQQKHVAPFAELGQVMVDDRPVSWTVDDIEVLRIYRWLRSAGFSEAALREPAPRWTVLAKAADKRAVLEAWDTLQTWRGDVDRFEIAGRATRKEKEQGDTND